MHAQLSFKRNVATPAEAVTANRDEAFELPAPLRSPAPFLLFMSFLIDFFLHLEARIRVLDPLRPTLVLALIEVVLLLSLMSALRGRLSAPPASALLRVLIWIAATLPFVEYPGSVLRGTWEPFFKAVAFFYFAALTLDTRRRLIIFLCVFIGCQLFRVLEPLYLHITTGYWGDAASIGHGDFMRRLSGAPADVINSNQLGFVIITILPFLHYFLLGRRSIALKALYAALAVLLVYALILTGSRGGLVGLLVIIAVMILQSRRRLVMLAFASCGALFVAAHLSGIHEDRYLSLVSDDTRNSATAEGRMDAMSHDIGVALAHPIFGTGVGTSREARFHAIGHAKIAHDMYGEAFIELGFVGLLLMVGFIISIFVTIRSTWRKISQAGRLDALEGRLLRAMIAWLSMAVIYNFVQFGVSEYHWYLMGGVVCGLANMNYFSHLRPVRSVRQRFR